MSFCRQCKVNCRQGYNYCPFCGHELVFPTDETRLITSLQDRILAANNSRELFSNLTEIMAEHLSASIFTLYLYDKQSRKLVLRAATGIPHQHIGNLSYAIGTSDDSRPSNITPWLFQQGKTAYYDDIKKVRFDTASQSFISDDTVARSYVGKYVDQYYGQVHQAYSEIPFISFMGAGLVIPETQEKLGVIKAELKCAKDSPGSFETFDERELRIFEAIVPTIALGVQAAVRMEDMRLLREGFEKAISIIKETYLQSLSVKDRLTFLHSRRVESYATLLGETFFAKDSHEMALLKAGSSLHDLGKMNIPKEILQKPDSLSPDEKSKFNLHPEYGVSVYYKNFHDSLDDLSWLFIILLHHVYPDTKKSYPVSLNAPKEYCHNFVLAYGIDPTRDIYNQFVTQKGNLFIHYNDNVRYIYSYRDINDLHRRFENLVTMINIVRLCDALDALTFVRHYQFDPKKMSFAIDSLLLEGRLSFPGEILEALSKNGPVLIERSETMESI